MGKFVKSSFDKLTNLVKPQSETTYDAPPPVKTYSLGKSYWSLIFYQLVPKYFLPKEGCNRGHGLSAAIKLGSLEKTLGASLIALWCVLSSSFL